MEITTIIGIIIALIIMGFGLRMILKKPADAAPSLDSELQVNADSQQPIIPRHVRHQLQTEPTQRVEPTLGDADLAATEPNSKIEPQAMTETQLTEPNETAQAKTEAQAVASVDAEPAAKTEVEAKAENPAEQASTETAQTDASATAATTAVARAAESAPESASTEQTQAVVDTEKTETVAAEFSLNSQIEKADIREFEEESSILDAHLHEQQLVDDESALATAESFIALNIFPERRILSGEKTLKVLLKYGLRFGEMSCFHRYNEDGSKLLFSVLQITDNGADGFDLETLSNEQVKGLAFFLALPHSDVQNAFDTMISISGLIAREIDGTVYDQNHLELTPQLREHWRHQAIDYRAGQASLA
ncbi:cell division protein ZipA C-terminal FtsZ-binding domain-containing protein [Acinetobacter indicus]|uniref:cell division protein ZipA C-terminal FtsZ-binding domain-containing protein n=1 Tax=Acinetobacter indicus TaxID=756892 RepID=UPI000CEC95C3|nr:cell division protein ZipA C-terminal FtsZ-binding domain-containing protein [Acinetobacter indicus]MCO8103002.1 cell division protein ZipA [Acinetobacter indicus]MDM1263381.1 cell division protein ZipA [Acinetobacter indicus]